MTPGTFFLQALESGAHTALQLAQFIVCNLALQKNPESCLTKSYHQTSFKLSINAAFQLAQ